MTDDKAPRWHETRNDDGIVTARLDRPPANALTADFLDEIENCFKRLDADPDARALVLKGYDKVFSAGMDLKILSTLDAAGQTAVVDALNRAYYAMYAFSKPMVAAVTGHAIAGGLFFLLCADYRVGAPTNAKFGLSEVRVGVSFPVAPLEIATAELPTKVARQLMLSGQPVGAEEAQAHGILDELVAPEDVLARAVAKAGELAASPAEAYAQVKQQIRRPALETIKAAIELNSDPKRTGWFTPETTAAALAVLAGKQ